MVCPGTILMRPCSARCLLPDHSPTSPARVDSAADTEFSVAESFLRSVERALDNARQGFAEAEQANVDAIQTI